MVFFTPQVISAAIAFGLVVDALSATAPAGNAPVPDLQVPPLSETADSGPTTPVLIFPGELDNKIQLFSQPSRHSSAIDYDNSPSLKSRSSIGPRRLRSDRSERRRTPSRRDEHVRLEHIERYRGQTPREGASGAFSPGSDDPVVSSASMTRRGVYMTKGSGNHRISINPVTYYLSDADHTHALTARGLLDPIIPIVGLIPGLEGVVKLVPELLGGFLGPALGGLIISPNSPQALAASNGNDTLESESQYILAATKGNSSTIWLVDTGRLAPPDPASTLVSNSTTVASERMVTLQMAFVDAKTGEFEPYCATYERDPAKPVSLGVIPCKDKNPKDSQMFAYNPETSVLRAIWESVDAESLALSGGMSKRQYMVGDGTNMTAEGAESMVVMMFQPANAGTLMSSSGEAVTDPAHTTKESHTQSFDDSTTSTENKQPRESEGGAQGNMSSSTNPASSHYDEDETAAEDRSQDSDEEDEEDDDQDDDDAETLASAPNSGASSEPGLSASEAGGLNNGTDGTPGVPSETVAPSESAATPIFVKHIA
ncbi:hypothetical protein FRC12_004864 [Ceratobasidium sp. 428]|nr:hypothetical protein FRC12_004864 [Ceratobasidium sp. 428]